MGGTPAGKRRPIMRSGWAVEHGRRGFPAVVAAAVLAGLAAPAGAARAAPAGVITTAAGGAGGPARATRVAVVPCSVLAAGGNLYVSDFHAVRRIAAGTDRLTTPAGVGVRGLFGDRGPATVAELAGECGMAVDHAGNLLLADAGNNRVRVVAASTGAFYGQQMTAGAIYTVAGDGIGGFAGDGGPAAEAALNGPHGIAVDHAGNLVVTDTFNQRVRVVAVRSGTFYGRQMTAGDIYTVAGDGVQGFSGDGGRATKAALANPPQTAVDGTGNLVIADDLPVPADCQSQVRVVAARSGTFYGQPMTAGDIYTVAGGAACGFGGDGGPGTRARLNGPASVAVDAAGNVVIADGGNGRARVLAARSGTFYGQPMSAGDIYTVAGDGDSGFSGDGGPASRAGMLPEAVALDSSGNLVIADELNSRVRVVAAGTGTFYARPMTAGDIYSIGGNGHKSYSGDRGLATRAQLNTPNGAAVDGMGNILVADTVNNRIRVAAARTGSFYGQPMTA